MSLVITATAHPVQGGTEVGFTGTSPSAATSVKVLLPPSPGGLSDEALGNAATAMFLLPALKLGQPLTISQPVSAALVEATATLQEIFLTWYPEPFSAPVEVSAQPPRSSAPAPPRKTGCFFSGGIDSFHTVQEHRDSLDYLFYVHGFDLALDEKEHQVRVSAHLNAAASAMGLPLIEIETNLRKFSDPKVCWDHHYHGAALAAIAHLLTPWMDRVYIPSSMTYKDMHPYGSHIYTDERWSTAGLQIVHADMATGRLGKIRLLRQNPLAMAHLRVCGTGMPGPFNCGACEECLLAMAALRSLDALREGEPFPTGLNLDKLAGLTVTRPSALAFAAETLEQAEKTGDLPLAEAVRQCLSNSRATLLAVEITPLREALPDNIIWQTKTAPRFRDAILQTCWETDPEWTKQELLSHLTKDPAAALGILWTHHRGWLIWQYLRDRLSRLNPFRQRKPTQP
jgi:hypothetical protein